MLSPKSKANLSIAIHGDKQQNERDWVLNEFKTGKSPIMVATDVASRGIGMIDRRSAPFPSLPLPFVDVVWLFCLKLYSQQILTLQLLLSGPGFLITAFSSLAKSSWKSIAVWLATFHSVSLCTVRVPRRIGFLLTCSSCIPRISKDPAVLPCFGPGCHEI